MIPAVIKATLKFKDISVVEEMLMRNKCLADLWSEMTECYDVTWYDRHTGMKVTGAAVPRLVPLLMEIYEVEGEPEKKKIKQTFYFYF